LTSPGRARMMPGRQDRPVGNAPGALAATSCVEVQRLVNAAGIISLGNQVIQVGYPLAGHMPIQAVRPSTITRLYRDLLTSGGRDGKPLAVPTVTHLHAVLRKAFRDAVVVDELIASNPVERAKRPRA
jgi:hypothetical protein